MMTREQFDQVYKAAEQEAQKLGVECFDLYFSDSNGISAGTFRDELSEFSLGEDSGLIVRATKNGKTGSATGTSATPELAVLLMQKAAENALIIEKDEETLYAEGGQEYRELPEIPFEMPSAEHIKKCAMDARNAAYASDERVADGTQGGAYASEGVTYLYSSKGLRLMQKSSGSGVYMGTVLDNGKEKIAGFDSNYSCYGDLGLEKMAKKAREKADERFGATEIESKHYPIVFEGEQMQQILGCFASVFFAKQAQLGLSALKNKEGTEIAAKELTLIDDPFYEGNPSKCAFDGEGTPTYTKKVIENGVLNTLLYNLESGKKAGKASTGNGSKGSASIGTRVYNFYIQPGKETREELFKKAEGGIFITAMKGFHSGANTVSGDFSIESEGFLIENGKKGRPVRSFTVSGNFFELLKDVKGIGDTIENKAPGATAIRCPDMYFENMSVAGK